MTTTLKGYNDFITWVQKHYRARGSEFVCLECGRTVRYLTKHSAIRHGVDVEIMPAVEVRNSKSW